MKTIASEYQHWEDVVFENRNRVYGAYALRRAYSDRVIIGFGITVAVIASLFYLSKVSVADPSVAFSPLINEKGGLIILDPPPILPERSKLKQQQESASTTKSTQIVVTKDPVESTIEPIENVAAVPDDAVVGGAIDGYVDGTSVEPVVEPVVAQPPVVRDIAEVMPDYAGGFAEMMKFIKSKIKYPASARRMNISGTVYVRFIVGADGIISNVEVIRGISKDCDLEAARVISSMPKWIAASQNGVNVPVRMVLPIKFALQ